VEIIKESLMKWGEAMQVVMENRSLFYSPVLDQWRVKKWAGKKAKGFLYDGPNFEKAYEVFLGSDTKEQPTPFDEDLADQG